MAGTDVMKTRISTIQGLLDSPTNRKWELFLMDGPYWNYMAGYLHARGMFKGREDLVAESVMAACVKLGRVLSAKRYQYPEAGKGYFRAYLKMVAFNAAMDVYRRTNRAENMPPPNAQKAGGAPADAAALPHVPFAAVSEGDLDSYDRSAQLERAPEPAAPEDAGEANRGRRVVSRDDSEPFTDDEAPSSYDPGSMFAFETQVSQADLAWVQKLQVHVLYIALGHLLCDKRISVARRQLLRLRFGCDMSLSEIHSRPEFSHLSMNALTVKMSHAVDELREEARTWWDLVAPKGNDFSDETILKLWRDLLASPSGNRFGSALRKKAESEAGTVE